jgi:AsmA protein
MKRPRIRLRWLVVVVAILSFPAILWVAFLLVVPTDWARQRIASRISAVSGRSVRIASVRIGFCGGVNLTGLEIGAPGGASDPWLRVVQTHLNICPLQLLFHNKMEPTETVVQGINLRILRREDGSLELDDLVKGQAQAPTTTTTTTTASAEISHNCPLSRLNLRIQDAQVTVIDMPTRTKLEFRDISGRAISEGRSATIEELHGTVNEGPFEVVAQLDRSTPTPSFEGHIRASRISLDESMNALGYLVPVLAGKSGDLECHGRLGLDLYLRGQGATSAALRESVVGHGKVSLDPIVLDDSALMNALSTCIDLPPRNRGRVGSVASDFAIKDGRISSDNLTMDLITLPIALAGWTDLDGRVNYRLKSERLVERLPSKAKELLAGLSIDARDLSTLKIEGDIRAPEVLLDGVALNPAQGQGQGQGSGPVDDRQRLRELGRRLRDRILR